MMLAALFPVASFATDVSKTKTPVVAAGLASNINGTVRSVLTQTRSSFQIKLKGLPVTTTNILSLDTLPVAELVSDAAGKTQLKFVTPAISTALFLDFDPRGKTVRINDGSNDVMTVVHAGAGEPSGVVSLEQTDLSPAAIAGSNATARARYKSSASGRASFFVKLNHTLASDYTLYVDGLPHATFTVPASGAATVQFDTQPTPPKLPLDFDPRGKTIDIFPANQMAFTNPPAFSAPLIARIPNISVCKFKLQKDLLSPKPPAGSGSGTAHFQTHANCQRDFRVDIEDVPMGDYDLYVGDVLRGTISVISTNGEIKFSTAPEAPEELPLMFDVQGATIEVKQGNTLFFSGKITGQPVHPSCDLLEAEVPLINTAADSDATGDARFQQDTDCNNVLRVAIHDLPAGDYTLRVDGVDQGTITVALAGGKFQGEQTLSLDPRGALIEVVQGVTVYLSRAFPN